MTGLRSKYQPFCFASRYLIFLISSSHFLNGWDIGSRKWLETVAKLQRIINQICGGQYKFIFFSQKFCFLFQIFHMERKTHIISFLENHSTNSRLVFELRSRYSSSTKGMRNERKLPHNLVSIFEVENVSRGKHKNV